MILCGTPGTGKTYAAAQMLRLIAASSGTASIAVCAPTGKAAVRITEAMRKAEVAIEATTIHRLLGITNVGYDGEDWKFKHDENCPLPYRWIVVDEVSMLDLDRARSLFAAILPGTHVLLVGDPYQLPPVGHGCPLRDCMAAGIPTAELTEISRNSGLITAGCKQIKDGLTPATCQRLDVDRGENLRLIQASSTDEAIQALGQILDALRSKPGVDVIWDVAILTPRNEGGPLGRKPLNDWLQMVLNPARPEDYKAGQDVWRLRDKVICLKNGKYDGYCFNPGLPPQLISSWYSQKENGQVDGREFVANGELGRVLAVDPAGASVILRFDGPTRYIKIAVPKRVQHVDGSESAARRALPSATQ